MSDLVILAFDTETGAGQMRDDLSKLEKEHLIGLEDAAVIVRNKEGKVKVSNEQEEHLREAFAGQDVKVTL
ncbi:MAG: hypothetical protein ABR985_03420 [Methanotrichaceae archaeon]|jgi:uncharacterized membrane protein